MTDSYAQATVTSRAILAGSQALAAAREDVAQIDTAYCTLIPVLGSGAAAVFLVSLIASGLSS